MRLAHPSRALLPLAAGAAVVCALATSARSDELDLTIVPNWEKQQAALESLRARMCDAWIRREPADLSIDLMFSVDAGAQFEFRLQRAPGGRMGARVTDRRRYVVPEVKDDPTGRFQLGERVYDTATTEEFDELGIVGSWPVRDPEPPSAVCSTLLDSPRSRIRLRNSTSGLWRDW